MTARRQRAQWQSMDSGNMRIGVRQSYPIAGTIIGCLLFFMLVFPKGGIKIENIPLTFGYLLTVPMFVYGALVSVGQKLNPQKLVVALLSLTLFLWSAVCILGFGGQSNGFIIAYFTSILYMPLYSMFLFNDRTMSAAHNQILKAILFAVRCIVIYGIFLFAYKYVTGSWIEVPYLTVNVADLGELDNKHINRGGIFKLISTYNNGNIFGVSLLIMLPLYLKLEKSNWLKALCILALLMTLSRTVWVGIILTFLALAISARIDIRKVVLFSVSSALLVLSIYMLMVLIGVDVGFLFDQQLGGRISQLTYLNNISLIPDGRGIDLPEIVYIGILHNYGLFGLLLFLTWLALPILWMRFNGTAFFGTNLASACMQGMGIYMIIALSDAAFNYIPVMMIFWMVAGLGLWLSESGTKNRRSVARRRPVREIPGTMRAAI